MSLSKWSAKNAPDVEHAESELDKFPIVKENGRVQVPFPYKDREGYKQGLGDDEVNAAVKKDGKTRTIALAGLHAIQHSVWPKWVRFYFDEDAAKKEQPDPTVVERKGVRYIYDGHHRLTAKKLLGARSAEVNYVDLDALSPAKKAG